MITQQNIFNHELVGLSAEVLESKNPASIGLSGKIIDETKSMLILETIRGVKMITKEHNKWSFSFDGEVFTLDGSTISKRPEDRIKVKI